MHEGIPALPRKSFWRAWSLFIFLSLSVILLILAPAIAPTKWQIAIMQGFNPVCHQLSDRSPYLQGVQLAVCHRCFGTYVGIFAGLLAGLVLIPYASKLWKYAGLIIGVSLVPLALDWGFHYVGLWENTGGSRVATGVIFGIGAAICLLLALWNSSHRKMTD